MHYWGSCLRKDAPESVKAIIKLSVEYTIKLMRLFILRNVGCFGFFFFYYFCAGMSAISIACRWFSSAYYKSPFGSDKVLNCKPWSLRMMRKMYLRHCSSDAFLRKHPFHQNMRTLERDRWAAACEDEDKTAETTALHSEYSCQKHGLR